jgi:hypothetical protein
MSKQLDDDDDDKRKKKKKGLMDVIGRFHMILIFVSVAASFASFASWVLGANNGKITSAHLRTAKWDERLRNRNERA